MENFIESKPFDDKEFYKEVSLSFRRLLFDIIGPILSVILFLLLFFFYAFSFFACSNIDFS